MERSEERAFIMDARRQVEEARQRSAGGKGAPTGAGLSTSALRVTADGALPPATAPFVLAGYEIGAEIHRGGQGVVYHAVQLATERAVAIKVQHGFGGLGEVELARFEREVRILAQLRHPNIVAVHDMGRAGGWTYYVMDFVDGLPLDRHVADRRLGPAETMRLMERVAWAVNEAHLRGVIHRDLKPGNILVDTSGEPRVLDFGLAKGPELGHTVTATGQFVGSLPWASPEQVSGDPGALDVRSDVYSLGVMLYRVLTDEFPYEVTGSVHAVISNIRSAEPAAPGIDDEIDTIVLKCLRKEPERRYQSAGELAGDIKRLLNGEAIDAKRESAWYVVRKQMERHRVAVSFLTVLALTLIASVVVVWTLYLQAEGAAVRAKDAEHLARGRLHDSRLSEARALRSGPAPGRRFRSLELLRSAVEEAGGAAALAPGERTVIRNEAIAAMSLGDAVVEFVSPSEVGRISHHISRDGALRAVGFKDGSIRVTNIKDGAPVAEFPAPSGFGSTGKIAGAPMLYQMKFGATGRYLMAPHGNTSDRWLRVWDIPSRKMVVEIPPSEFRGAFEFGPSDEWVAVGTRDGVARRSLPGGEPLALLELGGMPRLMAFDPDHGRVAAITVEDEIRITNERTGVLEAAIPIESGVHALAFSADGSMIGAAFHLGHVRVWETRRWTLVREFAGHQGATIGLEFAPGGGYLVSWGWDGTTRLWDLRSGELLIAPLPPHVSVRAGAGGPVLGMHRAAGLYRFEPALEYRQLNQGADRRTAAWVSLSPDGEQLLAGGEYVGECRVIRIEDGRSLGPSVGATWMEWSGPGEVIGVTPAGIVRWDATHPGEMGNGEMVYADTRIKHFTLLPGGRRGVAHDSRERIVVVDLERGVVEAIWSERTPTCAALKASVDGRWVCMDSWRGRMLTVWEAATGRVVAEIPNESEAHARGWFSRDGKWLVVSRGPEFEWYDTADWVARRRIERQDALERLGGVAAFSPDGSLVAVTGSRSEIWLLDAATLEQVATFATGDASFKTAMTFSPDGRWLLAGDAHSVVHTWDLGLIRKGLDELGVGW